ncbi:GxxExxY protein [Myxococcota bacterium]
MARLLGLLVLCFAPPALTTVVTLLLPRSGRRSGCSIEQAYHNALCLTLGKRGIEFEKEPEIPVIFEDVEVGTHRLDILIPDELVVELKAIKQLERVHFAVVRSYLRATGIEDGLILNFAKPTLEIRRVGGNVPV